MRRKTGFRAGIPCDRDSLSRIYRRQFEELAVTRRHIISLLNIPVGGRIFEPGCGTGLLGMELRSITGADYTGMDIDREIIPREEGFIAGDAVRDPLEADVYVTSFFFSSVEDPEAWLGTVRKKLACGGAFAVFAEYDYLSTCITSDKGMKERLLSGLESAGLHTGHGGKLDDYFRRAGFRKLYGGDVRNTSTEPDREFLEMHLDSVPEELPEIRWRIVWGIWRITDQRSVHLP